MDDNRKIIIIEDDAEDREVLLEIFEDLGLRENTKVFTESKTALEYFSTTEDKVLLILSDISLPNMTGLDLKKQIEADPELKKKTIPFIFYTSVGREHEINEAFLEANVHGYFHKASDYNVMREDIKIMYEYWTRSQRPV